MFNGGTCWFRTGKNPDSVVGITRVKAILCDEAGLYTRYFWENIQGRSSFSEAPIRIVTSPYSLNWLYRDYIKPKLRDKDCLPDVELIQAASYENPHFPRAEYERKKISMDSRRFNMMYGGNFDKMEGLVFDCFDEVENQEDLFTFPAGTKYYAGIDWGFTEPFALVVHAVTPQGYRYQLHEVYKSGLTLTEIGALCLKLKQDYPIIAAYADPSQPGSIEYLNRLGFPTIAANNDIRVGIDTVYEMIKDRRFKLIRGSSPHTIDEFDTYHYPDPKDLKPDQDAKEAKPVDQDNHACLIGATLVLTPEGFRKIEEICAGDFVDTPLGFKRVIAAGKTGTRKVIRLKTSDGRSIEATADHPFYIPFRGFIPIDAIRYGDILPEWKNTKITKFLMGRIIVGMASTIALSGAVSGVVNDCMLRFGSFITDQFQKACTSIIKITTPVTTIFQISNSSTPATILFIMGSTEVPKSGKGEDYSASKLDHSQRSGMQARKGESGTGNTQKSLFGTSSLTNGLVSFVQSLLRHRKSTENFARIIASRLIDVNQASIMFRDSVLSAITNLLPTSTLGQKPALRPALINKYLKPEQDVYNLSVEEIGCFYANGFLVSNCDALRYVTIMTSDAHRKLVPYAPTPRRPSNEAEKIRVLTGGKR